MKFKKLKIIEPILKSLEKQGYVEPTLIQEKTIPLLLDNKDVIGIAQTGTGKTAAFVVPILQKLHLNSEKSRSNKPKALILAPTRELAAQISNSFRTYGSNLKLRHTVVYGGVSIVPQSRDLRRGVDILIATPGRLLDLMNQRKVDLREIEFFVLDEADRMLDMGFLRDIKKIASALPKEKQSLFFSATMSKDITLLTKNFLRNPVRMEVTPESTPVETIEQCIFFVDSENKTELFLDLVEQEKMSCILVFVRTKVKAERIARILNQNKIKTDSIHGNKSQPQRSKVLSDFKRGKIRALVATDVAARGIDVENISHVINFDLPDEAENYVHRIGRTARAGAEGTAYSFCAAEEREYLSEIEKTIKADIKHVEHKYHSERAKDATGKDAKPKPRGQRSREDSRNNSRSRYGRDNDRFSRGRGSIVRDNDKPRNRYSRDNDRPRRNSGSRDRPSRDRYARDNDRPSRDRPSRDRPSRDRPSRDRYARDNDRSGRDRPSRDNDNFERNDRPSRDRYARDNDRSSRFKGSRERTGRSGGRSDRFRGSRDSRTSKPSFSRDRPRRDERKSFSRNGSEDDRPTRSRDNRTRDRPRSKGNMRSRPKTFSRDRSQTREGKTREKMISSRRDRDKPKRVNRDKAKSSRTKKVKRTTHRK